MKLLSKDGLKKLKKSKEFQDFKYLFAPNMNDRKYLIYNFLLFLFFAVVLVVFR